MSIFMRQNHAMQNTYEFRMKLEQCLWKKRKVGNKGIPIIFIIHAKNHARDCYCMYNLIMGYLTKTRDITQLHCMYYGKLETTNELLVDLQESLPLEFEEAEAKEGVMLNAFESKIDYKDKESKQNTVHMRSCRVVKSPVLYMNE